MDGREDVLVARGTGGVAGRRRERKSFPKGGGGEKLPRLSEWVSLPKRPR